MNENQISAISNLITELKSIDLTNKIAEKYSDQDINSVVIGEFSAEEMTSTLNRVLLQLESEITVNSKFLPLSINVAEYGNVNIQTFLQNTLNFINNSNFDPISANLKALVYYQIINGFWDRSEYKIHSVDEIKLKELEEKIVMLNQHTEKQSEEVNDIFNQLKNEKDELNNFKNQKINELQQIKTNLNNSIEETNQISNLLNNSTSNNEKINSVLEQQTKKLHEIEQNTKNLKTASDELVENLTKHENDFNEKLQFVESKRKYFEDRNSYLDELISREVGASLFKTFEKRKREFRRPIVFWGTVVVFMTLLTTVFIFGIFTKFFGWFGDIESTFSWELIVINTLKSIPVLFLLYYSITQYNKERNFQEEYAFKSAVALTIKAYADLISNDEVKDKHIFQSVLSVYQSPICSKTKKNDDVASMLDLAKNMLDTTKEIIKR